MIGRAFPLIVGLGFAAATAQVPEFTQQYAQRLGGTVAALDRVVSDFDASAAAAGLSRDAALAEMRGTEFLDLRRADMAATFARHARLRAQLGAFQSAGTFAPLRLLRHPDVETAHGTWQAFRPALPMSAGGAVLGAVGFGAGVTLALGLRRLARVRFRRQRRTA